MNVFSCGLQGPVCANPCPEGRYGDRCLQPCVCYNGAVCDHIDGSCICAPGFTGEKCEVRVQRVYKEFVLGSYKLLVIMVC